MTRGAPIRDFSALFDDDWSSGKANLDAFLHKVTECCVDWFEAGGVSLFLRDDLSGAYELSAQSGPETRIPEHSTLRSGEGIAGEAIACGKPLLVQGPDELGKKGRRGVGSSMVVPLATPESGCIGVLNVFRSHSAAPFTTEDLRTAETLARYVALAVNNARLFASMNRAVGQARTMSEKLDAVIANLGVGVLVITDFEEIAGWNPEAVRIFGEIEPGTLLRRLLSGAPSALSVAVRQASAQSTQGRRATRRAFDADNDQAWSVIASPLPSGGLTVAIQDVSDHERSQRELARVSRLAEIGQMTAAIAHEIRNPLTGIRSAAQMVQSCSDEGGEFGKIIEEEALKLNALCDQFLEFAKPLQLNRTSIDPIRLLRDLAERHRGEFEASGVELALESGSDAPTIEGDPLRLEQVVRNLLLNALQACNRGDRVVVRFSWPTLSVCDTGVGLSSQQKEQLFTPFFTTKANGTGLGLPTVRKIVDAHGWKISVESEPGSGARFTVNFGQEAAA